MKSLLLKLFASFGYEVSKLGTNAYRETRMYNFDSVIRSYEYIFSKDLGVIPPNEKRIEIMSSLLGTPPSEAYYIVESIAKTASVAGDICEFGVAQGVTSSLIANEIANRKDVKLHLFDSFEGLPKPTEKDKLKDDIFMLGSMDAYTGTMKYAEDLVLARLQALKFPKDRIVVHKGFIEDLIAKQNNFPKKVSFAYIDFDFYEPIKIALEYLDSVSDSGAIFVVDDYDWFSTGVKLSVEEFMNERPGAYELFVPDKVLGHFAVLTKK